MLLLCSASRRPGRRPVCPVARRCALRDHHRGIFVRLAAASAEAIAEVESGRPDPSTGRLQPWPWTINAEGAGAFFASKAEAIAAVRTLQARGVRSIDVGCMQVNLMFHPAAFASLDEAFDPRVNALYAAHFLNALYSGSRDWSNAIGAYHSQTQALAADYRRRVVALWRDPSANWHSASRWRIAILRHAPRLTADFAPSSQVYGAFAVPGANRSIAPPSMTLRR